MRTEGQLAALVAAGSEIRDSMAADLAEVQPLFNPPLNFDDEQVSLALAQHL